MKIDAGRVRDFFQRVLESVENRGEKAGAQFRFQRWPVNSTGVLNLDAAGIFEDLDLGVFAGDLDHFGLQRDIRQAHEGDLSLLVFPWNSTWSKFPKALTTFPDARLFIIILLYRCLEDLFSPLRIQGVPRFDNEELRHVRQNPVHGEARLYGHPLNFIKSVGGEHFVFFPRVAAAGRERFFEVL